MLHAYYPIAIPLELLKAELDRVTREEQAAKSEHEVTKGDLAGWQDILRTPSSR